MTVDDNDSDNMAFAAAATALTINQDDQHNFLLGAALLNSPKTDVDNEPTNLVKASSRHSVSSVIACRHYRTVVGLVVASLLVGHI